MPPRNLPTGTRVCLDGEVYGTVVGSPAALTGTNHYTALVMPDAPFVLRREFHFDEVMLTSIRDTCSARPEEKLIESMTVACSYCKAPAGEPCVKVLSHMGPPPTEGHLIRLALALEEAARQSVAPAPSPGVQDEDQGLW